MRGVIAAGHPLTAEAGADVLRAGGNAVDAAVAAMLASLTAESLLTALGGGGYMLVAKPDGERVLLDFFVEVPGRGGYGAGLATLVPVVVPFGDVDQIFNIGPASCGTYGVPAGVCAAIERFGSLPLTDLCARGVELARNGVPLNRQQAYIVEILGGIVTATPEVSDLYAPEGRVLREGERFRNPELAESLGRLGREGSAPFYGGDIGAAIADWVCDRGGMLTRDDLAAYEVTERAPVEVSYRGRDVVTNPPPSAGGVLIAYALALLERETGPPAVKAIVDVMERAQAERTPEFVDGLDDPGFLDHFVASRLGSTTHLSVLDGDGWACTVTCSNGEGAGIVVPGTGIHVNNMLGEQDLNPHGFHRYRPGRRMPSMMAPTVVLDQGAPQLALGSGGSNRIRSAILQTVINVLDRGLHIEEAVRAPRVHFEDNIVYAEPDVDVTELERGGRAVARFRDLNLFFGGVHAVERDTETGALLGGGDPRRGGAVVVA